MNKLFVNEFFEANRFLVVINAQSGVVPFQPLLSIFSLILLESQSNRFLNFLFITTVFKGDYMLGQIWEVLFRFFACASTKTFVVFYAKSFIRIVMWPSIVISNSEEWSSIFTLSNFDDRGDKLFQKVVS